MTTQEARRVPTALQAPLSRNVQLLLESRIPARVAWVGTDGSPRLVPLWFGWSNGELRLSTFAGSAKLEHLKTGTTVAVTIDTETFPYRSLWLRGIATVEEFDDLTNDYRRAAVRYLGDGAAVDWCDALKGRAQSLIRVQPTEAISSDMSSMSFMTSDAVPTHE